MNRRLLLVAALLVVAAGAYLFVYQANPPSSDLVPQNTASSAAKPDEGGEAQTDVQVMEMSLGSDDAPITIVEYASFTCPHCKSFHDNAYGPLKKNYIDTGKVKFVLREVYFDRFGLWAGMVARCDGPNKYFGIVDILFDEQKKWIGNGDPAGIADRLSKIGIRAGMSAEKVNACLFDAEKAKAMTVVYQANAQTDGVNATPTFFIDGEKNSNMSYSQLSAILDKKLGN